MDQPVGKPKVRWGQTRRLTFIDVRLQYDGRINRSDLMSFFEISAPQATADLGLYHEIAPRNLAYDPRQRVYQSQPDFKPVFGRTAATRYLNELQRWLARLSTLTKASSASTPFTGVVATPARALPASDVAVIVQAIRDAAALRVHYQSMDCTTPQSLLSPHAMGFDGLRWHVRAWCHARNMFRDFAIGRLKIDGPAPDAVSTEPANDRG